MITWNKGPSHFKNKLNTIKHILHTEKPHIIVIQEANILDKDDIKLLQIPNYRMELDNLILTNGMARLCMLIHEDIKYSRRLDLQNSIEPQITVTVYQSKQKINVIGYYRQWQTLMNNNRIKGSGSIKQQTERFNKTIKVWTKSIEETETIMLCDSNINTEKIHSTEEQKSSTDKALRPITTELIDKILNKGTAIMQTNYTRTDNKGKQQTLDQIMTTHPLKLHNTTTLEGMYSDHKMVTTYRQTKEPTYTPRYYQYRSYLEVSNNPLIFQEVESFLRNHQQISEAETSTRPDECATLIQSALTETLDKFLPLKMIQTNKQHPPLRQSPHKRQN